MEGNNKLSSLIPFHDLEQVSYVEYFLSLILRRNQRVVILFDQFDNLVNQSSKPALLKFLTRLAEDSVKYDSYSVLLCVTDPMLAKEILDVNGHCKVRLLQTPHALKWGSHEISQY
jgi:hypothetical protein